MISTYFLHFNMLRQIELTFHVFCFIYGIFYKMISTYFLHFNMLRQIELTFHFFCFIHGIFYKIFSTYLLNFNESRQTAFHVLCFMQGIFIKWFRHIFFISKYVKKNYINILRLLFYIRYLLLLLWTPCLTLWGWRGEESKQRNSQW